MVSGNFSCFENTSKEPIYEDRDLEHKGNYSSSSIQLLPALSFSLLGKQRSKNLCCIIHFISRLPLFFFLFYLLSLWPFFHFTGDTYSGRKLHFRTKIKVMAFNQYKCQSQKRLKLFIHKWFKNLNSAVLQIYMNIYLGLEITNNETNRLFATNICWVLAVCKDSARCIWQLYRQILHQTCLSL